MNRIEEIRARLNAATPGKWEELHKGSFAKVQCEALHRFIEVNSHRGGDYDYEDATFIAHAPEDIAEESEEAK